MGALHCIVNPASRDHTCGKRWPSISSKLESKGFEVVTHMTNSVGHASEIAWELRQQNVEGPIVAVGGEEVISSLDIIKQLWYNDIGDVLKVKVYRDGEFVTFDVKLKEFQFMNVKGK